MLEKSDSLGYNHIVSRGDNLMAQYTIDDQEKDIIGIGRMVIDTRSVSWNIPHLHFLVSRNPTHFEATCLEFGLVAVGSTQEESAEHLIEHTLYHIGEVLNNGNGFEEFKETVLNGFMNSYWNAYRHIEFCLAETKQDLSHEVESRITQALQELFDKKVKELIISITKIAAEKAVKEYERLAALQISSVCYSQLETIE